MTIASESLLQSLTTPRLKGVSLSCLSRVRSGRKASYLKK